MRRFLARNPFLVLGLVGLALGLLWMGVPALGELPGGAAVFLVARLLLRPFGLVATWIEPYLRGLPEWVDIAVTLPLSLAPYVLADVVVRRLLDRGAPGRGAPVGGRPGHE